MGKTCALNVISVDSFDRAHLCFDVFLFFIYSSSRSVHLVSRTSVLDGILWVSSFAVTASPLRWGQTVSCCFVFFFLRGDESIQQAGQTTS